jgi:hypothetical protein
MPTVVIRDEGATGALVDEVRLEVSAKRLTLRDLIRTRVREEVARANIAPGAVFRMLVRPVDAEEALNGYRLRPRKPIDWRKQAEAAEEAFEQNGFFVIVGSRQVEKLDEELDLGAGTAVRFVRLVPLVGG